MPYHRPDRIAAVWETIPSASIFENTPAPASLREWQARASTVERFAPWTLNTVNLTGAGEPAQLTAAVVSRELLPLLGVSPILGRNFTAEEAQPTGPPATLLTHDLWRSQFGARADILGQRLILSGISTNLCVLFTAHDAHMHRYPMVVLSDCCAAESDFDHNVALAQLKRFCKAEVCRSPEFRV